MGEKRAEPASVVKINADVSLQWTCDDLVMQRFN